MKKTVKESIMYAHEETEEEDRDLGSPAKHKEEEGALVFGDHHHKKPSPSPSRPVEEDKEVAGLVGLSPINAAREFWIGQIGSEPPLLDLPADFSRPPTRFGHVRRAGFSIDEQTSIDLSKYAKRHGMREELVLLASFQALLHRYTGQNEILVGVGGLLTDREHHKSECNLDGCNRVLPLRSTVSDDSDTFLSFLQKTHEWVHNAIDFQSYPIDGLICGLSAQRGNSRGALYDAIFIAKEARSSGLPSPSDDGSLDEIDELFESDDEIVDLQIQCSRIKTSDEEESFRISLVYWNQLFAKDTIDRMCLHYLNLVQAVTAEGSPCLRAIDILSPAEKERILFQFNDTDADYPREKTIHQLFEEQAEKTPDAVALVFRNQKLTYREVNERANRLAHLLRSKGVGADKVVGLLLERSFEMVIGVLGVLKAGGAYLPIDVTYPVLRIEHILSDSGAAILLTHKNFDKLVKFARDRIDLGVEGVWQNGSILNPEVTASCHNLAYVIYTSGTTGQPKGVAVEHQSAVNYMAWSQRLLPLTCEDRWLCVTPYTFDVSVWELFGSLLYGCGLVLMEPRGEREPDQMVDLIEYNHVTTLYMVPSMLNVFLRFISGSGSHIRHQIKSLSRIITSGETLNATVVEAFHKIFKGECHLEHVYGPAEATVNVTYIRMPYESSCDNVSIGSPISNTKVYIISESGSLQPVGVPGELCLAGVCLARGYLNRPDLTVEPFVENPFEPGSRMYRTGDLAKWLNDGTIEFLGRMDLQVKIRGQRIELDEIEHWLQQEDGVNSCVVVDCLDATGDKHLCAYLVSDDSLDVATMEFHLRSHLPSYMVPSYYVQLDEIPITRHGKVDRKALPSPTQAMTMLEAYVAPATTVEEKLAHIWQEVLGLEKVGVQSNFFHLGGHSLKVIQLLSRIERELGASPSFKEIFQCNTIRQQAQLLSRLNRKATVKAIVRVDKREYYACSSVQKRQFILAQMDPKSLHYNIEHALRIHGRLDATRIQSCFQTLVDRHESLRTSFHLVNGDLHQRVDEGLKFCICKVDLMGCSEDKLRESMKSELKPFDLSTAPLMKVTLFTMGEEDYALQINIHHIIADGESIEILLDQLEALYRGTELPGVALHYKDFAAWHNNMVQSGAFSVQERFWLEEFPDHEIPVLNLPTDFARPSLQSFEGRRVHFSLSCEDSSLVKALLKRFCVTPNMLFLSMFAVLLHRYSGQDDIIIGLPAVGRRRVELETLAGMFVNTLAFRARPSPDMTFTAFVEEVRKHSLDVYENQDYPYEMLVKKVSKGRDPSRSPLIDVMFVWEDVLTGRNDFFEGCGDVLRMETVVESAKFDLTLFGHAVGGCFQFAFEYCKRLFCQETVERMCQHFTMLVHSVIKDPKTRLADLQMVSTEELELILHHFNDTEAEYPREKTIHQMFEEQAEKTPDAVALVFGSKTLTYREVNERANMLAYLLRSMGVEVDKVVGLLLERSFEMVIGVLGVLKAGGAYLPIDVTYPVLRIEHILSDSDAVLLLAQNNFDKSIKFSRGRIDLSDESSWLNGSNKNPEVVASCRNLAYVMYTSGTTGWPKGVAVEHQSVVNHVAWSQRLFSLSQADRWLWVTPFTFDFSVMELFGSLFLGAAWS